MNLDFKAIFLNSPAPMMVVDRDFIYVAANPAYLDMVGKSSDEVIGKYVFDAFPETEERVDAMRALFLAAFEGEDVVFSEMPFRIAQDGVIKELWWTARHAVVQSADGSEQFLIQYSENVTESVRLREMRDALMGEMQHRVGNLFALVGAIARQTARSVQDVPDFMAEFEARMASLMTVNKHLTGDIGFSETIDSIIDHQLAVYPDAVRRRITVNGPKHALSMMQAQAVSMAVHELGTNSMKYGAMSESDGKVAITWEPGAQNSCFMRWSETGGPLAEIANDTEKSGYGTLLLTTIIPSQLSGSATREFGPGTFSYALEIGAPT